MSLLFPISAKLFCASVELTHHTGALQVVAPAPRRRAPAIRCWAIAAPRRPAASAGWRWLPAAAQSARHQVTRAIAPASVAGADDRCAHAIWRSCAVPATRSARRSSRRSTPKAVGNGGEPHPCATHGSGMPGGCDGTARPGGRPPHSPVWVVAKSRTQQFRHPGHFCLTSTGNAVILGMCSQPAPHICIVASQLRRVRVTYNKLTLMGQVYLFEFKVVRQS